MKKTKTGLISSTILATLIAVPSMASAQGYILDSDGQVFKDGSGKCVRDINWKKDSVECGGAKPPAPAPKVVAKPEPVAQPAPVAPVVKAEPVIEIDKPAAFVGFFATGKTELSAEAETKLDAYADYLSQENSKKLVIRGYTDSVGSDKDNLTLSIKRAVAVKNYLKSKGIKTNRMNSVGMGEADPVADNATETGRAENRRVVLEITN